MKKGVHVTKSKLVTAILALVFFFLFSVIAYATPVGLANCNNPAGGYEGFGRNTTGGAGKSIYRVTNLSSSGSGSLRDAVSQSNRCVVFDVAGTISNSSNLSVKGSNITIDGFTAPSPGITVTGRTFVINGVSNVIVRGIRVRDASDDGIRVYKASNIVLDHVSVSGFSDGAIDITENSRDVTLSWSILAEGNPSHNFISLNKYNSVRISHHHNLYVEGKLRNPHCAWGRSGSPSDTVCDIRNNLIWGNFSQGTEVRSDGTANVINNYYHSTRGTSASKTLFVEGGGIAYANGNFSNTGVNVDGEGNRSTPFPAIAPATSDAITAAREIVDHAGARSSNFGLDSKDQGYISQISIEGQPPPPPPTSNSADLNSDGRVDVTDLGILLSNWGDGGSADINNDGRVDVIDLGVMLSNWR